MLITDDELARRVAYIRGKKKLRLAFSGRLDHMKGAEYLPAIAAALRERKVDFELVICGGGPLEDQIKNDLERLSLGDAVKMKGVLEFKSELMPYMKNGVDLFVLSHVQGDPACTYLETLSCGVPIVGFDNEAFVGILEHADVGWTVPMRDIEKMADTIAHLDANRDELAGAALRSLTFARVHTFEETFRLRTVHLLECCERQTAVKKS
jgi:glycosyltransferase involved in cell wall biosynthesis